MKTQLFSSVKVLAKFQLIFVLLLMNNVPGYSQAPFVWSQLFTRPGITMGSTDIKATDIGYTENGNPIVAGSIGGIAPAIVQSEDACIVKYSASGVLMNEYYYDYFSTSGSDEIIRIIVKGDLVYALLKGQYNLAPSFDYDIVLLKLDTNLNYLGAVIFNGVGDVDDIPVDMGIDLTGNIYIVGNTIRVGTGNDIVLLKYDEALSPLFVRYFSSTGTTADGASAMKVEPNGVCNITGFATDVPHGSRLIAMKYWGNGVLLWKKYHDVLGASTNSDQGTAISYDPVTGDVYVTGKGVQSTNYDWVVVKFRGVDGTKLWSRRYAGVLNNDDEGIDISYFSSGAVYVVGNFKSTVAGVSNRSIVLRKLNPSDGTQIWDKVYAGIDPTVSANPLQSVVSSLLVTPSENIYVFGTTWVQTPGYDQANHLVINYTAAGARPWKHLISSGTSSLFQLYYAVRGAYIPSTQTLYVAGTKNQTMSFVGYLSIVKYSPASIAPFVDLEIEVDTEQTVRLSDITVTSYPNPFSDKLTISANHVSENATIQIVSITGQIVFVSPMKNQPLEINTSGFAEGIYQAIIFDGKQIFTKKIVKQ